MTNYQQPLWGYSLELPAGWLHKTIQDTEGFSTNLLALEPNYEGQNLGHLLIRGEWNWSRQPIEILWNQHVTKLSIILGAKKLGSASWTLGIGQGFEAEIFLPKKINKRLWIGILAFDSIILHFVVNHWKDERKDFEPQVTKTIQSLRFIERAKHISTNDFGVPLPPEYCPSDPKRLLNDIDDPTNWEAYDGQASVGALQAFFLRELPNYGFEIEEYVPYPAQSNLNFARFKLLKENHSITLGLLPIGEKEQKGIIVIKS